MFFVKKTCFFFRQTKKKWLSPNIFIEAFAQVIKAVTTKVFEIILRNLEGVSSTVLLTLLTQLNTKLMIQYVLLLMSKFAPPSFWGGANLDNIKSLSGAILDTFSSHLRRFKLCGYTYLHLIKMSIYFYYQK